jgi:hypothetical protein
MSTLFFKSPPHITMAEMSGDIPSTDALFDASTDAEFMNLVSSSPCHRAQSRSLEDFIAMFLRDEWTDHESDALIGIGLEHLITIMFGELLLFLNSVSPYSQIIAFHSIIFVSRTSLLIPSTYQVLARATARWKEVWHHLYSRDTSSNKSLVGFTKYGLELWWLAQKILEVAQSGNMQSSYMASGPTDSLKELHEFIRQYAETQGL